VLQNQIYETVKKFLRDRVKPTSQMAQNLVEIEVAYINTSHPDFRPMSSVNQFLETKTESSSSSKTSSKSTAPAPKAAPAAANPDPKGKGPASPATEPISDAGDVNMQGNQRGLLSFFWGNNGQPGQQYQQQGHHSAPGQPQAHANGDFAVRHPFPSSFSSFSKVLISIPPPPSLGPAKLPPYSHDRARGD